MSAPKHRQVGGSHYVYLKTQPWDVLPEWLEGWSPFHAFLVGNVVKYIARAPRKGARLDDARKAQHYLEELIRRLEDEAAAKEAAAAAAAAASPQPAPSAPGGPDWYP